jgi:UDP-N-acetylmuramoylalanine--D-glutamate ligase
VLIGGGRDKGVDLSELMRVAADTASAAVLIGESGPEIEARLRAAGLARTTRATTLDEAVFAADAYAHLALATLPEGSIATVLLSPAAASFDMFEDYAARGRAFIESVGRLAASRGHNAPTDGRPA